MPDIPLPDKEPHSSKDKPDSGLESGSAENLAGTSFSGAGTPPTRDLPGGDAAAPQGAASTQAGAQPQPGGAGFGSGRSFRAYCNGQEAPHPGPSAPAGGAAPPYHHHWPLFAYDPRPWRIRHPILFWGGLLLLLGLLGGAAHNASQPTQTGAWTSNWSGELDGPKLAVVQVDGVILDGRNVVNWIKDIHDDETVKGVLVLVNSPGGAVSPSQEIYFALRRLAATRPVVVSMGTLAASGGYYISLPAHHIVATPSTITGSIGVKMEIPNAEGLFQMIGFSSTTLASGDLKDAGSPFRPLSEREQQYFLGVVMDMFEDFIDSVKKHRTLDAKAIATISDGRALTGKQALGLGLVDSLGDRQDALHILGNKTNIDPQKALIVYGPELNLSWIESLFTSAVRIVLEQKTIHQHPVFMY